MDKIQITAFFARLYQQYYVAEEQKVQLTYQPVVILARKGGKNDWKKSSLYQELIRMSAKQWRFGHHKNLISARIFSYHAKNELKPAAKRCRRILLRIVR